MDKLEMLKKELPIISILDYMGYPYKKMGVNFFCKCPIPGHNDTHPTNCHFKENWHSMYCEVCGTSISALDLIMYVNGTDLHTAIETLWQIAGCPEWFKTQKDNNAIFLNKRQKELLNWFPQPKINTICRITETKPKYLYLIDNDGYLVLKKEPVKQEDFASNDCLYRMLYNKCTEKINTLKLLKKDFQDDKETLEVLKKDLKEIYSLRSKVKRKLKEESA